MQTNHKLVGNLVKSLCFDTIFPALIFETAAAAFASIRRRPLGDGRGRASGDGRGPGFLPRQIFATAEADGWRAGCLQAGAVTATRRGPRAAGGRREAVSVTAPQPVAAQDDVIFNEPGRRARVARGDGGDPNAEGSRASGIRHWGGFTDNISCVATGFASFMPAARRAKV